MATEVAILTRAWVPGKSKREISSVTSSFVLMTWNHLADGLDVHGGFDVADPSCLEWASRAPKIEQEIRDCAADIFCLQEANHTDLMAPMFSEYAMLVAPKLDSAAVHLGSAPPDGCAMFIKRKRFKIQGVKIHYYHDLSGELSNQNAIFAYVLDTQSGKELIVVSKNYDICSNYHNHCFLLKD